MSELHFRQSVCPLPGRGRGFLIVSSGDKSWPLIILTLLCDSVRCQCHCIPARARTCDRVPASVTQ